MQHRAYSVLHVKSFDPSGRTFSGIATTPEPDRVGDIVEPLGVTFKNPLPLLLFHNNHAPVGTVEFGKPTRAGVPFTASIPEVAEAGAVKDLTDQAAHFVKYGLIRAVSIGFRVVNEAVERLKDGGLRFLEIEVMELSLVPIPANQQAVISTIKSICAGEPAASGTDAPGIARPSAGVPAVVKTASRRSPMKKTITDQIRDFENTRAAKDAERTELMTKAADAGETLDAEAAEKYDGLTTEIKAVDEHLVRLRDLEATQKAAAVPVNAGTPTQPNERPAVISVKDNTPPGVSFARMTMAKVCSYLDHVPAREIVAERWPDDARLKAYFSKAAVPAGMTTNSTYAGNLVYADNLASEFVNYLRPRTLVGRLPLRQVPFNIRFASQTTGAVANWVGQGKGKPVTSFSTGTGSLGFTKIAAIAVISQELARLSSPSAEMLVRDELAAAVTERLDVDFIDPAHSASQGVNPASITNGVTPLSSAGTSADNVRTDLQNLLEHFILQNMGAAGVVLIMPETLALAASLLTNAFGQAEFPGLSAEGGNLRGIPVYTTQYAANQSGAGNLVIALKPSEIAIADDGGVDVSVSTEASLEMSDAPTLAAGVPTAAQLVSLWQTNSIGIKAERFVNWTKKRSTAVAYMDDVNWGSIGSPS